GVAGCNESSGVGCLAKYQAESIEQGVRLVPVIIRVAEREFSIFVNSGVLNGTREYQRYERYEHMRQDLELLARRCTAIKDSAERERVRGEMEGRTVAPIVEQLDRIARPELDAIEGADLLAEFAGVGQPIQPSAEEIAAAEEAAKRDREIGEEQQRRRLAELEEHNRELKHCTCATPQVGVYARHGDECPALSEDERQRRAEA